MADAAQLPEASMDFEALRAEIVSRRVSMPKRLAQVAEFVLAQPDEVALGTAAGLAARIGVQASTLVRFSQVLGLSGFSELQALCRKKLQQRWPDYEERIRALRTDAQADHGARLLAGFSEASVASILRLREQWDSARFSAAVAVLTDSDTLYLVGNRRSFPLTSYLAYMFGRLGIRHQLLAGLGDMDGNALDTIGPRDAMIAVGFSPYAQTTVAMAQRAAERGMRIVSITDGPFSPLARLATHWLEVVEQDHAGFRALGASFCLCMTLATAIAEQRPGREVP